MFRLLFWLLPILSVRVAAQAETPKDASDTSVAGTYLIRICRAPCNPHADSTLLVTGTVVLLSQSIRRYLPPDTAIWEDYSHRYRNACFDLTVVKRDSLTYAGIFPVGMVGWDRGETESISFSLYWSVDARYWVSAQIRDGRLHGRGQSFLAVFPRDSFPIDSIVGLRIAGQDEMRCTQAARGRRW
jgi:hypothetical protein